MFGIGSNELLIILVFAFLLFGPDKLPGMGRTIGRALRQFREAQEGFTSVVQSEVVDPLTEAINDPDAAKKKREAAKAGANVLLAASVFHFHIIDIPTLKTFLKDQGFDVNI